LYYSTALGFVKAKISFFKKNEGTTDAK